MHCRLIRTRKRAKRVRSILWGKIRERVQIGAVRNIDEKERERERNRRA